MKPKFLIFESLASSSFQKLKIWVSLISNFEPVNPSIFHKLSTARVSYQDVWERRPLSQTSDSISQTGEMWEGESIALLALRQLNHRLLKISTFKRWAPFP